MRVERVPTDEPGVAALLATVLVGCVDGGANVGFLRPLAPTAATAWWQSHLADPANVVLWARSPEAVLGTVTLRLAEMPNGAHRAEVAKLLVAPEARGRGLGRLLLQAVEEEAVHRGRRLLVLDTVSDSPAQRLYEAAGWRVVGRVEDWACDPDGRPAPTTFLTKSLLNR